MAYLGWHVLPPYTWRVIFKMKNWYWTDTVTIYPAWDRLRERRCPGSTINNSLSRSVSYFSMVTSHVQTWALDIFFPLKGALSSTHFSKWHYNSIQFFKNVARLCPLLSTATPSSKSASSLTCVPQSLDLCPCSHSCHPHANPRPHHSSFSQKQPEWWVEKTNRSLCPRSWDPFNCFPWDLMALTSSLTSAPRASATLLQPSLI